LSAPHHGWSERRFENVIGMMLRGGVLLAAAIVLMGGLLYLVPYGGVEPDYRLFRGEASDLRSMHAIFGDAAAGHSRGLIQLGLLLLIATPIARVAFSVAAYIAARDWMYAAITLLVLGILLYSLTSA
jgi:uncharacterized membrane protein